MIWNALIGARLFSGGTDTCVVLCWPRGIHKSRGETQSCNSWNWMGGSCHCKDYRHQQGWHPRYFAEELLCPSAKKIKENHLRHFCIIYILITKKKIQQIQKSDSSPGSSPSPSSRCPSNPEVSRDPLLPTAEPRPRQPGSRRPRRSRGGRPTLGNQKKTGATNQYTRVCIYIYNIYLTYAYRYIIYNIYSKQI